VDSVESLKFPIRPIMLSVTCVGVGPGRYVGESEGAGVAFLSEAGGIKEKEGVWDRKLELS
jgi:hypothetical protein